MQPTFHKLPIKFYAWKAHNTPQQVENSQSCGRWDAILTDDPDTNKATLDLIDRVKEKRVFDAIVPKSIKEVEYPSDSREGHGLPPSFVQLTGITEPQSSNTRSLTPGKSSLPQVAKAGAKPKELKRKRSTINPVEPEGLPSTATRKRFILVPKSRRKTDTATSPVRQRSLSRSDSAPDEPTPALQRGQGAKAVPNPESSGERPPKKSKRNSKSTTKKKKPRMTQEYLRQVLAEMASTDEEVSPVPVEAGTNEVTPDRYSEFQVAALRQRLLESEMEIKALKRTTPHATTTSPSKSKSDYGTVKPTVTEQYLLDHMKELKRSIEEKDLRIKELEEQLRHRGTSNAHETKRNDVASVSESKREKEAMVPVADVWERLAPLVSLLQHGSGSNSED
ncbi:hypothetical protein BT69DRAFT_1334079 [Atractiella rhizophila]|nr:hypothetical protein BT69DRAFT_1334079 [Atractiella rhizophila]